MLAKEQINIRDPYVLFRNGIYYLYGTRSTTCWGAADGFDCYTSTDLENWEGPFEVFHRPDDFFADRNYWAPECYEVDGRYILLTTLGAEDRKKGIYALAADSPLGPFVPVSEHPLTPVDWSCIDGSLYWEGDRVYLLFSHSFEDVPTGDMCAVELNAALTQAVGDPFTLFCAAEAPWAKPVPFAEAEFGMKGDVFFSDGPCAYRMKGGKLAVIWASWSDHGYAVGVALSESGTIHGPWRHCDETLFGENGGHGMMFQDREGKTLYTLHYPNDRFAEHPIFRPVTEESGHLRLKEE